MSIRLLHNFARGIDFHQLEDQEQGSVGEFELTYGTATSEELNRFAVTFELAFYLEEGAIMKMDYCSVFESSEEVDVEFLESNLARINAPAIAFPFLRATLAQIILLSGYNPVVLPPINFVEKAKGFTRAPNLNPRFKDVLKDESLKA